MAFAKGGQIMCTYLGAFCQLLLLGVDRARTDIALTRDLEVGV